MTEVTEATKQAISILIDVGELKVINSRIFFWRRKQVIKAVLEKMTRKIEALLKELGK